MQAPPGDERPARSVPETAEQHREHEIDVRSARAFAVSAEGNVKIIAKPGRERNVPPSPEVLDVRRLVRRVEIQRKAYAEEQRRTDGDIRVSGKVAINLDRIAEDSGVALESRILRRCVENAVDQVQGKVIADSDLLEETEGDEKKGLAPLRGAPAWRGCELRQEVPRADDRTGNQMGEEGDEAQVLEVALLGFYMTSVDVDDVAHRFEREKADSDGQRDAEGHLRRLDAQRCEQRSRRVDSKVEVLEETQDTEVQEHRAGEPDLADSWMLGAGDRVTEQPVDG